MELKGKKALIIGASRGIGEAIASAFIREGADIVIAGRKIDTLNEVKAKIETGANKVLCLEWDIKE